jgi:2-methylcitrate dehydratase PrpD
MSDAYSLIEQLARHLQRPVDDATRGRARLHLLDWLGCVAGARESEAAKRYGCHKVYPQNWYGNILEMDDIHREALLHPGPVVWPAALQGTGTFDEFLTAATRGYEAMIAVGATLDDHHYQHWHPTATAGTFGAAATNCV